MGRPQYGQGSVVVDHAEVSDIGAEVITLIKIKLGIAVPWFDDGTN
jgi:hypothetical protein